MRLEIRHEFRCAPEVFWQVFWDPEYDRLLDEAAGTTRTVVREWEEGGKRRWISRFEADAAKSDPQARLLGGDLLDYEQENSFDERAGVLEWRVIPHLGIAKAALEARGVLYVTPAAAGCARIVEGEIKVSIPLVGARLEAAIHGHVLQSYERSAATIAELIASRLGR
ncbi:MAG: DUF2505 family protein [Acidobacteria bacterium]|nr:DUF2505 family protein [Acidobacteriota bacterium]